MTDRPPPVSNEYVAEGCEQFTEPTAFDAQILSEAATIACAIAGEDQPVPIIEKRLRKLIRRLLEERLI